MPPMRTHLLLCLALLGACGDETKNTVDSGTGSGSDAAGSGSDASTVSPSCMTYCTDIQAHCMGANAQYPTMEQCLGTCAKFPVGNINDTSGNTLGCRQYHAGGPSQSMPEMHCFHAGPGGSGADGVTSQCGSDCDGFC